MQQKLSENLCHENYLNSNGESNMVVYEYGIFSVIL